jgi:parallel beta-helix repeat protein
MILNNTIVNNLEYGIYKTGSGDPNVSNCILWYNGTQVSGVTPTYSCIQDWTGDPNLHNISTDPCFVNPSIYNYHLLYNSPCIDTGDSNVVGENETDIDGQPRIMDGDGNGTYLVDRGADERCYSPADFSNDGWVDFIDYSIFAAAWRNYNELCDLVDNDAIDYNDLRLFCEEWLGRRCWDPGWQTAMMGGGDSPLGGEGMEFSQETFGIEGTDTSFESEPAPQEPSSPPEMDPNSIEEMIEWLDEAWQSGLLEGIPEYEYLQFRTEIEQLSNQ